MYEEHFKSLVIKIMEKLDHLKTNNADKILKYNTSDKFEQLIFEIAREIVASDTKKIKILYTKGSHKFPDLVFEYPNKQKMGIEVKSSISISSAWKTNGNSILGSTRDDDVELIYIVFGKLTKGYIDFKCKLYQDAVSTISVTHSPRYILDMNLRENENFFAKSGISFEELSQSNDPIGKVSSYFAGQGKRAWWIADTAPPVIRILNDLPPEEKREIIAYGFTHFPELLSSNFYNFAAWLAANKSVVSYNMRDFFTAGGREVKEIEHGTHLDLPRIMRTLSKHKDDIFNELRIATSDELSIDWGLANKIEDSFETKLSSWRKLSIEYLQHRKSNSIDEMAIDWLNNIFKID